MAHTITTHHQTTPSTADTLDRIWAALSSADRHVLLGHDDDALTSTEKVRLARVVGELARRRRRPYRTLDT